MCGICGIVNIKHSAPPETDTLNRMIGRLRHRGPDSSGYYRDSLVALGHARLSIIDLESGAQPLSNEDGSIWITFNGEIFNYVELASELRGYGHQFKTKSDTEVIVHAYEQWGTSCFSHFNGQWAIGLWDIRNRRVILSRDRLGIRPLYYTFIADRFLFASEIKALFADRKVAREFDPVGLSEIFTFWSPIAPRTVFKGVEELRPGHYAVIENGRIKSEPYWSIMFPQADNEDDISEEENASALRERLIESSRLRFTRSDVPVGAYLSGGIDSSITSAIVANYTEAPLKTFSIRFSDSEFDEGSYQQEMVKMLGAVHRDVIVTHEDIGNVFPDVIWHTERPILRTAPAPLFLLSKLVRESGYKVVVTGEGADEVLAGYDIFREAKVRLFLARDPGSKKRANIFLKLYPWMARNPGSAPAFARSFFGKGVDIHDPGISHRTRWDTSWAIRHLVNPELRSEMEQSKVADEFLLRLPDSHHNWDPLSRAQWLEMVSLLSGYILSAQGDRMLMANSVEGRFPFLDCNVVDFANHLPARHKLLGLDEKHLLKAAFRDLIPTSILNRPKQPYRAPDAASFFNVNRLEWVEDLLSVDSLKRAGIFIPDQVVRLIDKARRIKGLKMSNTDNMRIVAVLSTMLTYHHYIANDGRGKSNETPAGPVTVVDNCLSNRIC
ncbi:Asparagine synthetase [uncultured Desulfobacterium sp.]|uniref:asparagine synthase (glutamine-hydrolyzing) n=1 Tax=uncultured Desulfobacterium sp. TaxID=201089 RepID=A0A445MU30_9BACT|nr:Asparagine synthetase [uncultured Desulfobacterium sp.]